MKLKKNIKGGSCRRPVISRKVKIFYGSKVLSANNLLKDSKESNEFVNKHIIVQSILPFLFIPFQVLKY